MRVLPTQCLGEFLGQTISASSQQELDSAVRDAKRALGLEGDEEEYVIIFADVRSDLCGGRGYVCSPVAGLPVSFWEQIPPAGAIAPAGDELYKFTARLYRAEKAPEAAERRSVSDGLVAQLTGKRPHDLAAIAAKNLGGWVKAPSGAQAC